MGKNHSEYVKGQVKGLLMCGKSAKVVSNLINVQVSTIENWKRKLDNNEELLKKIVTRKKTISSDKIARRMKLWLLCGKCRTANEVHVLWNQQEKEKLKYSRALKRIGLKTKRKIKKPLLIMEHK